MGGESLGGDCAGEDDEVEGELQGRDPPKPYDLLDVLPLLDGECGGYEGGGGQWWEGE